MSQPSDDAAEETNDNPNQEKKQMQPFDTDTFAHAITETPTALELPSVRSLAGGELSVDALAECAFEHWALVRVDASKTAKEVYYYAAEHFQSALCVSSLTINMLQRMHSVSRSCDVPLSLMQQFLQESNAASSDVATSGRSATRWLSRQLNALMEISPSAMSQNTIDAIKLAKAEAGSSRLSLSNALEHAEHDLRDVTSSSPMDAHVRLRFPTLIARLFSFPFQQVSLQSLTLNILHELLCKCTCSLRSGYT